MDVKRVSVALAATATALVLAWKAYKVYEKEVTSEEPAFPRNARKESRRLWKLFAKEWKYRLKHSPETASFVGDHKYSDQLSDLSPVSAAAKHSKLKEFLSELKTIDYESLDPSDKLNYNLFDRMLRVSIEEFSYNPWHWQGNQLFGPHLQFLRLSTFHPFRNKGDVGDYISRLKKFPQQAKSYIASLQSAIDSGETLPSYAVQAMIAQCKSQVLEEPGSEVKSALYAPFGGENPLTAPFAETALRAIRGSVIPAYKELATFLETKYLPKARKEAGIWSIPNGSKYYEFLVSHFTTSSISADEVHQIGLREVKNIRDQIFQVATRIGVPGSFSEIQEAIKRDKDNFFKTPEDVYDSYNKFLVDEVEKKLPQFFSTLPKAKITLRKVEPYAEQKAPPAYYFPGEPTQSVVAPRPWLGRLFSREEERKLRPGLFYVNTYKPEDRPTYSKEVVALHEGLPGHHLQVSIAQELEGLPRFRTTSHEFVAYVEGWGLYCEWLGKDMGYYQNPLMEFGRLNADIWRAVRLVVDTGIHSLRWTREKALEYMKENTFLSETEAKEEIDRYIVYPGQALSYKIGQLKILELRQHAIDVLGGQFSYPAFHEQILNQGALPLDLLEKHLRAWVSKAYGK